MKKTQMNIFYFFTFEAVVVEVDASQGRQSAQLAGNLT